MSKSSFFEVFAAQSAADFRAAAKLFRDYANELAVDLCFQHFEKELAELPGSYAAPRGTILLAIETNDRHSQSAQMLANRILGCVAVRPIDELRCEMKRMYVAPEFRSMGAGRRLAQEAIQFATAAGYQAMLLDTLERLTPAIELYRSLGFNSTDAYYANPLEGVVYLSIRLYSQIK